MSDIEVCKIPSHFSTPQLIATFEQSRSPKGVAVGQTEWSEELSQSTSTVGDLVYRTTLGSVLKQLRAATIEAHGVDVMPHQDDWYWLEPWPPRVGSLSWIYRTILKYGDGVTSLRDHAAFTLRMAEARGVKIRIPIHSQQMADFDMRLLNE